MAVQLEIRDGDPHWWDSPDIWVVPGADPFASAGPPVSGQPAYVWARVSNGGSSAVSGAQVKYYWSNPATGVLRSNSTSIGSAFVDLQPGEAKDVLCLVPWVPTVVNEGHECLVVEVFHANDPLPTPLPDPFHPPDYRQVAQRNLNVVSVTVLPMMFMVQLSAPKRRGLHLVTVVELGAALSKATVARLGLQKAKFRPDAVRAWDFAVERTCRRKSTNNQKLATKIDAGTSMAVYLQIDEVELAQHEYTTAKVLSYENDRLVGGVSYVIVGEGC